MRCSCGEHDIKTEDGRFFETCHFCGHATTMRAYVDWELGRLYYAACHSCALDVDKEIAYEDTFVLVHLAPIAAVRRADNYRAADQRGELAQGPGGGGATGSRKRAGSGAWDVRQANPDWAA